MEYARQSEKTQKTYQDQDKITRIQNSENAENEYMDNVLKMCRIYEGKKILRNGIIFIIFAVGWSNYSY